MNSKTKFMESDEGKTRIWDEDGSKTRIELPEGAQGGDDDSQPPVAGWLAVVGGPGKGRSRELSFGMNIIGLDSANRVSLDFGDTTISRMDHFRIVFDGRNKKFLIAAGTGDNLVYIGNEPVVDARPLLSGTEISLGKTTLRFVALCSPDWSWPDAADV